MRQIERRNVGGRLIRHLNIKRLSALERAVLRGANLHLSNRAVRQIHAGGKIAISIRSDTECRERNYRSLNILRRSIRRGELDAASCACVAVDQGQISGERAEIRGVRPRYKRTNQERPYNYEYVENLLHFPASPLIRRYEYRADHALDAASLRCAATYHVGTGQPRSGGALHNRLQGQSHSGRVCIDCSR